MVKEALGTGAFFAEGDAPFYGSTGGSPGIVSVIALVLCPKVSATSS
jgi:hypothetical protein